MRQDAGVRHTVFLSGIAEGAVYLGRSSGRIVANGRVFHRIGLDSHSEKDRTISGDTIGGLLSVRRGPGGVPGVYSFERKQWAAPRPAQTPPIPPLGGQDIEKSWLLMGHRRFSLEPAMGISGESIIIGAPIDER
jgi:hypothetical protein